MKHHAPTLRRWRSGSKPPYDHVPDPASRALVRRKVARAGAAESLAGLCGTSSSASVVLIEELVGRGHGPSRAIVGSSPAQHAAVTEEIPMSTTTRSSSPAEPGQALRRPRHGRPCADERAGGPGRGRDRTAAAALRQRRSVGAWCFIDHYGPMSVDGVAGMRVPPHPHIGLQTVTWLISGNVLHRDSLAASR